MPDNDLVTRPNATWSCLAGAYFGNNRRAKVLLFCSTAKHFQSKIGQSTYNPASILQNLISFNISAALIMPENERGGSLWSHLAMSVSG